MALDSARNRGTISSGSETGKGNFLCIYILLLFLLLLRLPDLLGRMVAEGEAGGSGGGSLAAFLGLLRPNLHIYPLAIAR